MRADGHLAVLAPVVGHASETFVQRHVTGLLPGRTLAVSTRESDRPTWHAPEPMLRLAGTPGRSAVTNRLQRISARVRGRAPGAWRWEPSPTDLERLDRAFTEHNVEVVLTEYLDIWLPLLPWMHDRGVRVHAHSHGYDVAVRMQERWWRERYLAYGDAESVIAVSEVVRGRLVAIGLDAERIHVIPCGVDVPDAPAPIRPVRPHLEVLAVGRMVPKKNPLGTIEAFRLASKEVPSMRLTMAGDGPLLAAATATVRDAGLTDQVRLLGAQTHEAVVQLLAFADVFVQHSVVAPNGDEEGLPVAVLEAMAATLPVVSTRHAGIPEAVLDGVSGDLVAEGDVEAMADALVELALDHDRRRAYGLAGHALALERFSWPSERASLRSLLGVLEAS